MADILIFVCQHRYEEAVGRLVERVGEGRLRYWEDIVEGIENCPGAIAELYREENLGKRLFIFARGCCYIMNLLISSPSRVRAPSTATDKMNSTAMISQATDHTVGSCC